MIVLVATSDGVLRSAGETELMGATSGLGAAKPTCLAAEPGRSGRAWCGTARDGVFRTEDAGASWHALGLRGERVTALAASPSEPDVVWAGTEPSEVWRSADGGTTWQRTRALQELPSSPTWSFPPRPHTHHVRWIACDPGDAERLWVAVEAGALVSTRDGGQTWLDRVPDGPWDTHELAIHPERPRTLRVAAGDGYFESHDAGATWSSPEQGLDVGYLRSVAIDPGRSAVVLVSAASHAHAAYVAGSSDGRLYRRVSDGPWQRVVAGWPDPPDTIAPLLRPGSAAGELWAADERGVHRSDDGGSSWRLHARYPTTPRNLTGLAVVPG
ncbi:MAG: WD40/YVTN/BNR-like repeat-containing protein [Longimicrobiales bacterium]